MTDFDNSSEEFDFDSMSQEELKRYIESGTIEDEPKQEEETTDPDNGQPDNDSSKESDNPQNSGPDEDQDEFVNDPVLNRFSGKSKRELAEMVLNGTKKISEQGNQLHEFKSRLESIEKIKPSSPDTSMYDKSDVETISAIAQQAAFEMIKRAENERITLEQQRIEKARSDNDSAWNYFKQFNPETASKIEKQIIEEVQSNPDETVNVPGWAVKRLNQIISTSTNETKVQQKTVRRDFNSGISNGTSSTNFSQSNSKEPPNGTAEEIRQWYIKNQGIDPKTGQFV